MKIRTAVEAQRASTFVSQGQRFPAYKDKQGSRYQARTEVSLGSSLSRDWVEQDVNMLFKTGNYLFSIPIKGKTNNYTVTIEIDDFLTVLNRELETQPFIPNTIVNVLRRAIATNQIKCSCTCPDYIYRFSYVSTLNDDNSGRPEGTPAPITNPTNTKGSCKHILRILTDSNWVSRVARSLYDYVMDIWRTKRQLFDTIIRPAMNDITDAKIQNKPEEQKTSTESVNSYYQGNQFYDADQEFALSICEELGADVRPYVTPSNTPEQIQELGEAYKSGIPFDLLLKLTDPQLPYITIRVISKGSKAGIDLMPYMSLTPKEIEKILRLECDKRGVVLDG